MNDAVRFPGCPHLTIQLLLNMQKCSIEPIKKAAHIPVKPSAKPPQVVHRIERVQGVCGCLRPGMRTAHLYQSPLTEIRR